MEMCINIPVSDKSEVFDVSGAGDTCVATFITALATGAMPSQAAELSNFASGIAVRKMGTATVSDEELIAVLKKIIITDRILVMIIDIQDIEKFCEILRKGNKTIASY